MCAPRLLVGSISSTFGPVRKLGAVPLVASMALTCVWPCKADQESLHRMAALEFPVDSRVPFVELQMNRLLREPAEQRGTVWIEADGALVMRIEEPHVEERRLHQGQLSLRRLARRNMSTDLDAALEEAHARTTKLDVRRPAHLAVATLADVLRGDVESLGQRFDIGTVPASGNDEDDWTVELVPMNAGLRKTLGLVRLHGKGIRLVGFDVEQDRNDANSPSNSSPSSPSKKWRRVRFLDVAPSTAANRHAP